MSMAHAVEVRPPFLDHRIVEFAASLPAEWKIHGSCQKVILKELMKDKLPARCDRKKVGFDIPAHEWLRGPLRSLLIDGLQSGVSSYPGLFQASVLERYLRCHLERKANLGYHLWGLLILFLWMKRWRIEARRAWQPSVGFRPKSSRLPDVLLFAAAVYLGCIVSPPSLMDDVDAVQAQVARNMLTSGDWVTARLDGVAYLEKAPLIYWLMAGFFRVLGPFDWAATPVSMDNPLPAGRSRPRWHQARCGSPKLPSETITFGATISPGLEEMPAGRDLEGTGSRLPEGGITTFAM